LIDSRRNGSMAPVRGEHDPGREVQRLSVESDHGIGKDAQAHLALDAKSLSAPGEVTGAIGEEVSFGKRCGDFSFRCGDEGLVARFFVERERAKLTKRNRRESERDGDEARFQERGFHIKGIVLGGAYGRIWPISDCGSIGLTRKREDAEGKRP
jgi:hypothetical protein